MIGFQFLTFSRRNLTGFPNITGFPTANHPRFTRGVMDDSDDDDISNLVLLDNRINSGMKFSTSDFLEKQQYIISRMYQNKFILPCTVKLFLKCYNAASDIESVHTAWTERDKDQYFHSREGLVPTLMRFANGE